MTYTQLTQEQRYQIFGLFKLELSQTDIAITIGGHKSTVSRVAKLATRVAHRGC
jgi:IS30 family transposase